MVEDEDAGARRPEMPLVLDLQLDAGDRGREIAEQAEREIDGLALRPGQRPDRQAGGERADERAGRIDGAGIVDPARRAAASEALPRPAAPVGDGLAVASGVDWTGLAGAVLPLVGRGPWMVA